jgi:signal transduction histidine kinase
MTKLIVAVFLCFLTMGIQAQNTSRRLPPSTQSLEDFRASVSAINDQDSLLRRYYQYTLQSFRSNPRVIPELADLVLELDEVDITKKQAFYNLILSKYWERPRPDSAIFFAEKSIKLFEEINDRQQILSLKISLGNLYLRNNEFLNSEDQFLDAVEIVNENKVEGFDKDFLIERLANLYVRVGATEIAIAQYEQLLDSETGITGRCETLLRMSNAYRVNNQLEKAKEILTECDKSTALEPSRLVSIKKSYGTLERLLGNYDEAVKKFEEAVEIQENLPQKDFLTYLFLAQSYLESDEIQLAEDELMVIESFNLNRIQLPARVEYYLLKSELLYLKKDFSEALIEIEKGLELASQMQPTLLQIDVLVLKGKILERMERYEEAYNVTSKVIDRKAIVEQRAEEMEEAITKVRFQMRAKNQELEDVTSELGTVKTRNALVIILLMIITGYIFYRYRIHFFLKEERTRNKIARDLHDDLSATLSSISFFSEAAKRDDSKKYLERIDESAAEAKEKINDIIWAIDPENDEWESFLTKCKRFAAEMFESKDIAYEIDIDTTSEIPLEIEARKDIWLIYKEIITNLVRHSEASEAKVSFIINSNLFVFTVEDNGSGFDTEKNYKGNGLNNIKKRVSSISKKSDLILETEPGKGTKWEISLQL